MHTCGGAETPQALLPPTFDIARYNKRQRSHEHLTRAEEPRTLADQASETHQTVIIDNWNRDLKALNSKQSPWHTLEQKSALNSISSFIC